jgi:hypothetical protein
MKITRQRRYFVLISLLACAGSIQAYLAGPPLSLEKMTEQSDLIFKGTVISSKVVNDPTFPAQMGFESQDTQFKIVSVMKGDFSGDHVEFLHYGEDPKAIGAGSFEPQWYDFTVGRTYLIFARKDKSGFGFRQAWMNQTGKSDQGVVLCVNAKPVGGSAVKGIVWLELLAMLHSTNASDVTYAIRQLDQLSGGLSDFNGVKEFDRLEVFAAVRPLMADSNSVVAKAAIEIIGSHNPHMPEGRESSWLATIGSGKLPGLGTMDPKFENVGGKLYSRDLAAIADGKADDDTRSLAVLALGLVRDPDTEKLVARWLKDPAVQVRNSAILLLADFPELATHDGFTTFANDSSPQVRVAVAHSIGFGQFVASADILSNLLTDADRSVRAAAAMSLLSFSPANDSVAKIFQANIQNEEFYPLFLNALARNDPKNYLDGLSAAIERNAIPKNWSGGKIPTLDAWEILFRYLQAQPVGQITSGKFDRYLDAMEKVGAKYSSSEPRDVYAFYIQRGMTARAAKYREAAQKVATYDLEHFFNEVDLNPSIYKRE